MYAVAWQEDGETCLAFYSCYSAAEREYVIVLRLDPSAKMTEVPECLL